MRPSTSRLIARVAAHVGDAAEQEHRRFDAALDQRARDDEAVAAVVAAPAQHADLAVGEILERRLHRRHRLAAGILHQHDRRDADLVDRPAIGLPHLLSVEHAHPGERTACARLPSTTARRCRRAKIPTRQLRNRIRSDEMPMRGAVYVNGRITPAEDAVIPVYDHGFLYGEGIYETLRTYSGVPFLYDRHVRRLRASASHLAPRRAVQRRRASSDGSTTPSRPPARWTRPTSACC